jgi:uncharacterized protein YkwD
MATRIGLAMVAALALAGCAAPPPTGAPGSDIRVYRIGPGDRAEVQFRLLDSVNTLRRAAGLPTVRLDPRLTAAAATHARDMAVQNRPWHFSSDGSSPLDRVRRAGYPGRLLGENISETFETELQTLAAWMDRPDTRDVIMHPDARDLGFAWYQEQNGKLWWTLVMGAPALAAAPETAQQTTAATR